MDTNDCQRELEDAAVRASNSKAHRTTILSVLEDASEVVLRAAERCEDEVAEHAHIIRCLRASRGGTSGTSQTARTQLRHHRLKAMALEDAHLTLTQAIYNKEDKLKPLLRDVLDKLLELEIHRANLARCEEAIEQRAKEKAAEESGVLVQASRVVASLARRGVQEGHWSTVSAASIEKIRALIMEDNAAAGLGSPDKPREDWKPVRGGK